MFTSIQGESGLAGVPWFFIRLTGCPLRCTRCDSEYAFHEGENYTVENLVDEAKKSGCKLVEVTGGEPLGQKETIPLLEALLEAGFKVMLETSGAFSLKDVPKDVIKVVDIKCPGSGMSDRMKWEIFETLDPHDEVKCVIANREDYDWAVEQIKTRNIVERNSVLFSPVWESLKPTNLAEWILEDRLPVKMQVQLHKVLWPEKNKGF